MNATTKYRVTNDYERQDLNELTLKSGDIVEVLKKGKYIWYGRLNNTKGFFPGRILAEMKSNTSTDYADANTLTSAISDNKTEITKHTDKTSSEPMNSQNTDEEFKAIDVEPLLNDGRRTRVKSTGRPPSHEFMKTNILQKSDSMDNLSIGSKDDESESKTHEQNQADNIDVDSKVSELASLLKKKPSLHASHKVSNDATNNKEVTSEVPSWRKMLRKPSVPAPPNSDEKVGTTKQIAPWMQEIKKKRSHKLSLRSDDENEKMIHSSVKHPAVDVNSGMFTKKIEHKSETRTNTEQTSRTVQSYSFVPNDVKGIPINGRDEDSKSKDSVMHERLRPSSSMERISNFSTRTKNINKSVERGDETKQRTNVTETIPVSFSFDTKSNEIQTAEKVNEKEEMGISKTAVSSVTSASFAENSTKLKNNSEVDSNMMTTEVSKSEMMSDLDKYVDEILKAKWLNKTNEVNFGELKQNKGITENYPDEVSKVPKDAVANKILTSTQNSHSLLKATETIMINKVNPTEVIPKVEDNEEKSGLKEVSDTKENKDMKKTLEANEYSSSKSNVLNEVNNEKIRSCLDSLLKQAERLSLKHDEIKNDIRKLEKKFNEQHEEMVAFIQETKAKCLALIEMTK